MNFDMNSLMNMAKIFSGVSGNTQNIKDNSKNKPRKAEKSFDKSKDNKVFAHSPFAAQNGLGEPVDIDLFEQGEENAQNQSSQQSASENKNQNGSPFENLASIMQKKNDFEKLMPMFSTLFSQKAKTAETQSPASAGFANDSDKDRNNTNDDSLHNAKNVSKEKENGKSRDLFSPIAFAGYTALCALNRLYFATARLQ